MKSRMVNALNATPELGYSGAGVTEKWLPSSRDEVQKERSGVPRCAESH